jgi:hypothetical protein
MIALEILARAKGGEGVKSGPIGLAVILVLCVAAYFLFKSMSKHLKRVRDDFPSDDAEPAQPAESPATADDPAQPDTEPSPRSDASP